jgi:hypothetical protein
MYRVLKYEHWLSFVFAHKDPEFWYMIIDTAIECGFEYKGSVVQNNGQSSFKKRQNPWSVLSGQFILNFRKVRNPQALMRAELGMDINETILQCVEGIIAKYNGATIEQINNELTVRALDLGFLHTLKKIDFDLDKYLNENFVSDNNGIFSLRPNAKFKSHIDVNIRIMFYVKSVITNAEIRGSKYPTFDEIVFEVMPLLRNGKTPDNQTILNVLQEIAEPADINAGTWKLKTAGQKELF